MGTVVTVVTVAVAAVVIRTVVPRVIAFVPVKALQTGWGAVAATAGIGLLGAWGIGKLAGARWGQMVMGGAVAVSAVMAADLIAPVGARPATVSDGGDVIEGDGDGEGQVESFIGPTQLADGTTIEGAGDGIQIQEYFPAHNYN